MHIRRQGLRSFSYVSTPGWKSYLSNHDKTCHICCWTCESLHAEANSQFEALRQIHSYVEGKLDFGIL